MATVCSKGMLEHLFIHMSYMCCIDRTNWDMYPGYCYWGGDCILCTKQVVDSGPGRLATSCCRRRRLPPLRAVASCGGRWSQGV